MAVYDVRVTNERMTIFVSVHSSSLIILKHHEDDISGQWWWSRQFGSETFVQRHFFIRQMFFFLITSNRKMRDRAMRVVSLCSAGQETSTDMHIDLYQSPLDQRPRELRCQHLKLPSGVNKYAFMFRNGRNTNKYATGGV